MYLPKHFDVEKVSAAFEFIEQRQVGNIVVASGSCFEASFLPWKLLRGAMGTASLRGHVSKANPLVELVKDNVPGIVIFDLVDGYISPSWYPSKQIDQKVVPTWNYLTVHVHGRVALIDNSEWVEDLVTELTISNESDQKAPWQVSDAPREFIEKQLKGIVGVEVLIERIEAKAKLSQNRSASDVQGTIEGLGQDVDRQPLITQINNFRQ
ncbi:MAG: transcriptional regulator [Candidatus Poriferisodalaceae bacterium]|jgi:transcriptional regulator|tara:strand:+ start:3677 stop:4306 length:630 start_codon:yes stop_codon:yes gene_type:complete